MHPCRRGQPPGRRAGDAAADRGAVDRRHDRAIAGFARPFGQRAGTAAVLDSRIPPLDKVRLAQDVLGGLEESELPDLAAAFEERPDTSEYRNLLAALEDQLDRAVTDAFSGPFLLAAALTLCALIPVALMRRRVA